MKCRETLLGDHVTLLFKFRLTHLARGTASGGQFGWGGTPLKPYQRRPKVDSDGSEIRCRVQKQKSA